MTTFCYVLRIISARGVDGQRRCAAGAPGLALRVPHPLRALTILRNSSGALLAHWESDLLVIPPA